MSLIKCLECEAQISDKAISCPNCGNPNKTLPVFVGRWGFQWRTKNEVAGWPLVHIAVGRDKKTGKLLVAKGIIAIGQFAFGLITIAQFGIGVLFGFGQFTTGYFAIGQIALGYIVLAQVGIGKYILAQVALGKYVWATNRQDVRAVEFFKNVWQLILNFFT